MIRYVTGNLLEADAEEIFGAIQNWNDRKKELFTMHHIQVALTRLREYDSVLGRG